MSIDRFLLPIRKLTEDKVPFVIVGGLAVVLHGHLRLTMDLDLAISLSDENIKSLVKSLTQAGFVPRLPISLNDFCDSQTRKDWINNKGMKALNLWIPPDPFSSLDIMIDIPIDFDTLLKDSQTMLLEEAEVKVASIDHLISLKEKAGRDTDKSDIIALRKIKEVKNGK